MSLAVLDPGVTSRLLKRTLPEAVAVSVGVGHLGECRRLGLSIVDCDAAKPSSNEPLSTSRPRMCPSRQLPQRGVVLLFGVLRTMVPVV